MNRADKPSAPIELVPAPPTPANGTTKLFTMEEVEKHITKESAWFVHSGRVYDATPFLKEHPGGADSILLVAGTDATEEFDAIHSGKAKTMLLDYYIGDLAGADDVVVPAAENGKNFNSLFILSDVLFLLHILYKH